MRKRAVMVKDSAGRICTYKNYDKTFTMGTRIGHGNKNVLSIWEADGFGWAVSTTSGCLNICIHPEDVESLIREFFKIPEGNDLPIVLSTGAQFKKIINSYPRPKCPICGSTNNKKHGTRTTLKQKVQRRQCQECWHVWNGEQILRTEPAITFIRTETRQEEQLVTA